MVDELNLVEELQGKDGGPAGPLDSGKLPDAQLPSIAVSDTFTAANETEQLALTVQKGDVCVRTDENKSYINTTGNNTSMLDWQELLTPTDAVLSVDGKTGAVDLSDDYEPKDSTIMKEGENVGLLNNDQNYQSASDVSSSISTHASDGDAHHDKSHAHDGVDGSGTVDYDDLTNKPSIPVDHSDLDNIGDDDHHAKLHGNTHVNGTDDVPLVVSDPEGTKGLMPPQDKYKLNNIEAGADVTGDHEADISLANLGEKSYSSLTDKPTIPDNLTDLTTRNHSDLQNIGDDDHHDKDHASTHSDGGDDEITVENLATAGSDGQVLSGDGSGGLLMETRLCPVVMPVWNTFGGALGSGSGFFDIGGNAGITASEDSSQIRMVKSVIKALTMYISARTGTSQLVLTVRKNKVNTALIITIDSTGLKYQANDVSFDDGDRLSISYSLTGTGLIMIRGLTLEYATELM